MSTLRKSCQIVSMDSTVFPDRITNQITTTNPIGNFTAYVTADLAADNGVYAQVNIPKNYVGSPVLVVKGLIDGAPGAADVLGVGVQGLAVADNESEDAAFSTADLANKTIGSNGDNYSNEDLLSMSITLTNLGTLAVDDLLFLYVFNDVSVTTFAGNFLIQSIELQYADQ